MDEVERVQEKITERVRARVQGIIAAGGNYRRTGGASQQFLETANAQIQQNFLIAQTNLIVGIAKRLLGLPSPQGYPDESGHMYRRRVTNGLLILTYFYR
jgi:hypothetical protein